MLILVVGRIEFPAVEGRRVPFLAGGQKKLGTLQARSIRSCPRRQM